jgi:DNA-binding LacI/PurR family transcriptional regulator
VQELTAARKFDDIICANHFTAAQLMHSLAKAKIRVPDDMRLIGFDNLKYAELFGVPLTTVSQPLRDMAANAMRAMLNRLEDPTCRQQRFSPIRASSYGPVVARSFGTE